MPSPIAHTAVAYTVYRVARRRWPAAAGADTDRHLLLASAGLSLLPDLDFLPGLLIGKYDQFHNGPAHSLFFGLVAALLIGFAARVKRPSAFLPWFLLSLACYELHVVMDFFTAGRGVLLFWPFAPDRLQPPINLFYGLHRSDGWLSVRHLWTVLSESLFGLIVVVATRTLLARQDRPTNRSTAANNRD